MSELKSVNYWHYFLQTWYSCSCVWETVFSLELLYTITFHGHTFTFLYLSEIIPTMKYSVVYRWLGHKHWKTSWYFQLMSLSFFFWFCNKVWLFFHWQRQVKDKKHCFLCEHWYSRPKVQFCVQGRNPQTRLPQNWPMKVKLEGDHAAGWIWDGNLWEDMSDQIRGLAQRPKQYRAMGAQHTRTHRAEWDLEFREGGDSHDPLQCCDFQ